MKAKLGIRFSDNDFMHTVIGFLRVIHDGAMYNPREVAENLTKARVVQLFNSMAPGLYQLYQNGYTSRLEWDAAKWLNIIGENVYLDDEVDEYADKLRAIRCGNGEFHYYDYHGTLMAQMTGQKLEPIIVTI